METEDIVELGIIAVVLIAVAYILAKALGFLNSSGVTGGISSVLSPVGDAVSTVTGDASVPLSNANLFFQGIDNLFTTGSIYGDPSTN